MFKQAQEEWFIQVMEQCFFVWQKRRRQVETRDANWSLAGCLSFIVTIILSSASGGEKELVYETIPQEPISEETGIEILQINKILMHLNYTSFITAVKSVSFADLFCAPRYQAARTHEVHNQFNGVNSWSRWCLLPLGYTTVGDMPFPYLNHPQPIIMSSNVIRGAL